MNSHPFYIAGPALTIDDLIVKLVNNDSSPPTLLDVSNIALEDVDVLGLGWYRLANLYIGYESRTLLVFKQTDPTLVIYKQNFESRRMGLPSARQSGPPTDPNGTPLPTNRTTTVYGYLKDLNQNPLSGQTVKYKIEPAPQTVNDIILDKEFQSILTSETGYFEFTVPGGLTITVLIPSAKFQKTGTLPYSGRVEASTLDLE